MAKIFLSYRRQISAGIAGRIFDRLRAHFGDGAVFMDIDSVPFGEDFQKHIDQAVAQCDVVLAVIGRRWSGKTGASRRIDDPRDFVRIELESALQRDIPVILVLLDRTKMPSEAEVPPSLAPLAFRNAIDVDQGRDFHPHVDRLIRGIELHFERRKTATFGPWSEPGQSVPKQPVAKEPEPSPAQPGRERTNSIGMKLVRIDAGEFLMGTTKDQVDRFMRQFPDAKREYFDYEQPQHRVTISQPFYLGIHEVTQGEYQTVMGQNPSNFKGSDDLPVENVSWFDAVEFCNKLSARENLAPYYRVNGTEVTLAGGNGYRLPTEAEWEYASRANAATLYPFGDDVAKLSEHAWYSDNAEGKTHPVGQKLPNAWGVYDILGNVWEWCADGYDEKYYASSPPSDPPGASKALHRVFRDGGWYRVASYCRPASGYRYAPGYRSHYLGFRVGRSPGMSRKRSRQT